MARLKGIEKELHATPDKQLSITDPDARAMKTGGKGIVGYNVQTAVDSEHHLIVAHEVTNKGSDRAQLYSMSQQAKDVLAVDELTVVADRGYYNGEEILACEQAGITTYIPKVQTSGNLAKRYFEKRDFIYPPKKVESECENGRQESAANCGSRAKYYRDNFCS